jgi:hypothetical protein
MTIRMRISSSTIWGLSFLLLAVSLVALATYTRTTDRTLQECIARVVDLRSGPANVKDRAELRLIRARYPMVVAAAADRMPTDAQAREYRLAERAYEGTLRRTLAVRSQTTPERYCDR